jgi:hypothetical protein
VTIWIVAVPGSAGRLSRPLREFYVVVEGDRLTFDPGMKMASLTALDDDTFVVDPRRQQHIVLRCPGEDTPVVRPLIGLIPGPDGRRMAQTFRAHINQREDRAPAARGACKDHLRGRS